MGEGSASGACAAVATGHPRVSEVAAELLEAGGNAFDAVVGAGFASVLAEPGLTSLGGGGFLLARRADGVGTLFDFFVDTPGRGLQADVLEPHFLPVTVRFPASEQVFNVGLGSVAVPGNLLGFLHVHARLGRLPLSRVLAPAVRLARDGVEMNARQAYFLGLLEPIMTLGEPGRGLYAPRGRLLREGERLVNPELADFLESLPRGGVRDFYQGELASRIHADMRAGDGLLTQADLARYRVIEREPLRASYRHHTVLTNPPPAFGGRLLAHALRTLEAREPAADPRSGAHLRALVSAMADADRRRDGGAEDAAPPGPGYSRGTTHISLCDAEGNVASMTASNGEGSGYVVPGTGIMLNNMMGEDDLHPEGFFAGRPGVRVASGMSPSLLLRDGRPRLVLGSGGSKRIRSALLQVISLVVDFDRPVAEAVEHPRAHWDGDCVQLEPGFPAATVAELAADRPVNEWPGIDVYFGGVHAVAPRGEGGGDPRRGGSALVFT